MNTDNAKEMIVENTIKNYLFSARASLKDKCDFIKTLCEYVNECRYEFDFILRKNDPQKDVKELIEIIKKINGLAEEIEEESLTLLSLSSSIYDNLRAMALSIVGLK